MSKYTLRGSTKLDAQIDSDLAHIAEAASPHCISGVLLGGYGRGEGTPFINSDGSQAPFNDYDLVVIVDVLNETIREKFRDLEKQLTAELGLPVDLCPYVKSRLPRCEFSLLNYEMKHGHKVIWGEPDILTAMPDYPLDRIPLSEGTRLLMNRGKLLLDIQQRLARPEPLSNEEHIRFIKFLLKVLLAFGDCALLTAGRYNISYATKSEWIEKIDTFPRHDFIVEGYLRAVKMKAWGDFQPWGSFNLAVEFETVREVFLEFFPWYQTQYSERECSILKALALNRSLNTRHPRERLYSALEDLLQNKPTLPVERFYELQRRFS